MVSDGGSSGARDEQNATESAEPPSLISPLL
jgi:hypothetical protein